MMKNKALINYYARLIMKGNYQESDVPEDIRGDVKQAMQKLELNDRFGDVTKQQHSFNISK